MSMMQIPGVPVIYGLRNALFIERPSAFQYQFAKATEEQRSHMSELEHKMLNTKKRRVAIEEREDFSDGNEFEEDQTSRVPAFKKNMWNKENETKDKVQFKRKKAKVENLTYIKPFLFHYARFDYSRLCIFLLCFPFILILYILVLLCTLGSEPTVLQAEKDAGEYK